jgi:hypothetical protein
MASFRHFTVDALDRPVKLRACDCPGCNGAGEHRAPKSRAHLNEYYWFCLDHVREYNRQWDYFAGMSMDQIANHVRAAGVWDRPSWPLGQWGEKARAAEQKIHDDIVREFFGDRPQARPQSEPSSPAMPRVQREALATLELTPPIDFIAIKAQYRVLVKRHHPDLHGGSVEAEEKFKGINQAFTVLREMYGEAGQE